MNEERYPCEAERQRGEKQDEERGSMGRREDGEKQEGGKKCRGAVPPQQTSIITSCEGEKRGDEVLTYPQSHDINVTRSDVLAKGRNRTL